MVPSSSASILPVTVSTVAMECGRSLCRAVPRAWIIAMTILVGCLLASMTIALVKLI